MDQADAVKDADRTQCFTFMLMNSCINAFVCPMPFVSDPSVTLIKTFCLHKFIHQFSKKHLQHSPLLSIQMHYYWA